MTKKILTEWKDQGAKCEGDAVSNEHYNKPRSHVDTLAQDQASVDFEVQKTGPRPTKDKAHPVRFCHLIV